MPSADPPAVEGLTLIVRVQGRGQYVFEFWDTRQAIVTDTVERRVGRSGVVALPVPAFSRDIAIASKRKRP